MWIYTNYQGKKILAGELVNGIFRKRVQSWQKLYVLNAYGLDKSYIDRLEGLGCKEIQLLEVDTGTVYTIGFQEFCDMATPRSLGNLGTRLYLPLKYWHKMPGRTLARTGGDLYVR